MKYDTKVAIITFVVFFVCVILSVTVIVVVAHDTHRARPNAVNPTPTPSPVVPSPVVPVNHLLLKDGATDLCYQIQNTLPPQFGGPGTCAGEWLEHASQATLVYDGAGLFEFCIQPPTAQAAGSLVQSTFGAGCNGVKLMPNHTIQAVATGYCIQNQGGSFLWGSCDQAYVFTVVPLSA